MESAHLIETTPANGVGYEMVGFPLWMLLDGGLGYEVSNGRENT